MSEQLPDGPMTVVRLTVDSFKKLVACDLQPSPTGLIPVRGKNAAGKSSLIESMLAALLGRKGAQALPIAEGQAGADVVLDLGAIVVRRHWKRGSDDKAETSLSVQAADGSSLRSPQAILDALVGEFADPVAFLGMKADEQVKGALAAIGLGDQVEQLEEQAQAQYDRRRDLGREADRLAKAVAALEAELGGLPSPPTEGTLEECAARLQEAERTNAAIGEGRRKMAALATRGEELAKELELLKAEQEKVRAAWKDTAKAVVDAGEPVDAEPIREAIRAHELAAKHAGKHELLASTTAERDTAQSEHEAAVVALEETRAELRKLLAETPFPMKGVTYDPDERLLRVGTIPFTQASQAERLKLAAAVAMAGSPKIRVLFAREGSLLDDESKVQLAEIAESSGFQLWLEVVDSNPSGAGVWIEDGRATLADPGS